MKRFLHSILPAFLLAVSVGQIYAFTNFSSEIATSIGSSQKEVQFAFSLGIFFLGMGAAFFGKIVEKDIKLSTYVGMGVFGLGLLTTAFGISMKSLLAIYLGYGVLVGLGTGIIYITPVKTMMLWFPKSKAIAAAVPIISFGLGSTLSTIIYKGIGKGRGLYDLYGIANDASRIVDVLVAFSVIYFAMMLAASMMLRKPIPENTVSTQKQNGNTPTVFSYGELLKDRFFIRSWLFMFLNISAGLCLIPLAKQMMDTAEVGYAASTVTLILGLCGIMNGGGRFLFAWWSDHLGNRRKIMVVISVISAGTMATCCHCLPAIGFALLVINACYGAGFSVIPAILSDHYGMGNISKIHGAVLSAWGFAGLAGNQIALFVGERFGGSQAVIVLLVGIYLANMCNCRAMLKMQSERR